MTSTCTIEVRVLAAAAAAMRDRALRGHPLEVYLWLSERLDVVEYRPVKNADGVRELRMRSTMLIASLRLLRERGYVRRRRGSSDSRLWMYRLVSSIATEQQPPASAPVSPSLAPFVRSPPRDARLTPGR